jgi:hypothetical protein
MKPKFTITDRKDRTDDLKSLRINGSLIWELTGDKINEGVLNAIMKAYFIGARDTKNMIEIDEEDFFDCEFENV